MRKYTGLLLIFTILSLIFVSGCVQEQANTEQVEETGIETISINGIDTVQEISNDKPIKLIINGQDHIITVKENTVVEELVVNGIDIMVYLPEGSNPQIKDSGIDNTIAYY